MRILALDPGERVGWASAVVEREAVLENGLMVADQTVLRVTGHGIAYLKDAAMQVYRAVALEKRYDVVVYEEWVLTAKGARVSIGSRMESSQFVGMLRQSSWIGGAKCIGQRTSALSTADRSLKIDHPSAADVARRIAAADAVSHDDGHDGSALRHLWAYFFKEFV